MKGFAIGARAFGEDVLEVAARRSRIAERVFNLSGLRGFSTHLQPAEWVRAIREPIMDELGAASLGSAGILDVDTARRVATSYFSGGVARPDSVITLVDLIWAHKNFGLAVA